MHDRIEKGLKATEATQRAVGEDLRTLQQIAACVRPSPEERRTTAERRKEFEQIEQRLANSENERHQKMARTMRTFLPGLFISFGEGLNAPADNYDLERFFRLPKGHERRITGHKHAGTRLVREGPTLLPTLQAHRERAGPFTGEELRRYLKAQAPPGQVENLQQHRLARRGRSTKRRPTLLAELQVRYQTAT